MSVFSKKYGERQDAVITKCYILAPKTDKDGNRHYCETDNAMWDTGSTNTSISQEIVAALNLQPIGKIPVSIYGGSIVERDVYEIDILLPGNIRVEHLQVMGDDASDYDVLIGMDVITLGDMCISNKDDQTCFSFRLPSKEHIELTE